MKSTEIEKEEILDLNFPKEDVLNSRSERSSRWLQLKSAVYGEKKQPAKQKNIVFKSVNSGIKNVKSRVLRTKPEYIILSGGYIIPMRCIYEVE